MTFDKKTCFF